MPTIYDLKPRFQGLLRPVSLWLVRAGVTANQVTWAALALSTLAGAAVYRFPTRSWPLLLLPGVLFLRMALNAIDGMMAREHDGQTPLGALLNEVGDVLSDGALYLPLAEIPGVPAPMIVASVLLAAAAELTGVVAGQIGASRRYDGPLGKSDRAFVFGTLALLLGLGVRPGTWLDFAMLAVLALQAWTIVNRGRRALNEATTR